MATTRQMALDGKLATSANTRSMWSVWTIVIFVVELMGIITAIRAVMDTRTPQGALAWVGMLILVPWVALPAYWIFGQSKFRGYVLRRRRQWETTDPIAREILREMQERGLLAERGREEAHLVEQLAKLPFTSGNDAELLTDNEAVFASIFAGIEGAKKYVLIEYYILEPDEIGHELQRHLIAAAERGVKVCVIYDEVGSFGITAKYLRTLRETGVDIRAFHTRRGWVNRWQFNFRNHRKIVVVDGEVAWTGGFNMADACLGRDADLGPWRDTQVKLMGPIVPCIQLAFFEDWLWAAGRELDLTWEPMPAPTGVRRDALALLSGPADPLETCTLFFLNTISSARQRLWIASPYFVPDEQFFSALKLAALRGVDVRILVPEKPDHLLVKLSGWSAMTELTSVGIKFYRYREGFMHQKILVVDEHHCTIGTANFDNRSFRLNFEITIAFADEDLTRQLASQMQADFAASLLVEQRELEELSYWRRLTMRVARLTAPIQ